MGESLEEFMRRRSREIAGFGRAAETAAHEAYGDAIRTGRDLRLGSTGEVMRYGAGLIEKGRQSEPAKFPGAGPPVDTDRSVHTGQGDGWLNQNRMARAAAGDVARRAGNIVGVGRGAVHAVEGLGDGAGFLFHLATDSFTKPPGQRASDQLIIAGKGVADYVKTGAANPQVVMQDIRDKAHQMRVDLDPEATPPESTLPRELRRNFDIGKNQGEAAFDVGSLAFGGPMAKGAKELGAISKAANAEKYLAQGFSPAASAYLAEPYKGMGHHFGARRLGLPSTYSDSVFNVLKPNGISRGDMYELHFKVDPRFYAAPLPRRLGGGSWRGKALSLEKYDLPGQLWNGSPAPLKARVGGLGAAAGAATYDVTEESEGW